MSDHQQEAERMAMDFAIIALNGMNYDTSLVSVKTEDIPRLAYDICADGKLAALLAAQAELKEMKKNQIRLSDLVRQQRMELHESGLISDKEYAELATQQGSVARLETYDQLRTELSELKTKHENLAKYARETWDKYAATQADNAQLRAENTKLQAVADEAKSLCRKAGYKL